jgi:hypothetical protein
MYREGPVHTGPGLPISERGLEETVGVRSMLTELKMPHGHSAVATRHFSFPHELIDDPSLNASQKRAILCEWASDACAVESFPALRWLPGTTFPVTFSAVMDALAQLDRRTSADISAVPRSFHQSATIVPMKKREVSASV